MTKAVRPSFSVRANEQAAMALLAAALAFLHSNNAALELDLDSFRQGKSSKASRGGVGEYRRLVRAYEDMGMVMSTWFSHPKYLDGESRPLKLPLQGSVSVRSLVRSARVTVSVGLAAKLMRRSPSIRVDDRGKFVALRRVFFLPDFEVPRAALVIERYLDTLRRNSSAQKNGATLLLERNCHVPEIDLKRISPILRDIRERGTAFMDSVDGDIEAHRVRRSRQNGVGELGVLTFAWTRPSRGQRK
jgi:hypothetical protein